MIKICSSTVVLFAMSINVGATLPVIDATAVAQSAGNQLVNVAHYAQTELNTLNTQVNTLRSWENSLVQLSRMGDPAMLRNLPGVSTVAELYQVYGQLKNDYSEVQGMVNPSNLQSSFNSILSSYQQPAWQGFTSSSGTPILPNMGAFQFPTNDWNIATNVQQQLAQLEQRKATLTQQRDANISSMNAATDQSTQQKFSSMVTAENGAIADINQSEQQLYNQSKLQQSRNASAQSIYQHAQSQQQAAAAYHAIDDDMNQLPSGNFRQLTLWGQN